MHMCVVEGGMVSKQQNCFLFRAAGEKRDVVQKMTESHKFMMSGILTSGGGREVTG